LQSEPDRRAAQQQRVQQQARIQIAIHALKLTNRRGGVKRFLARSQIEPQAANESAEMSAPIPQPINAA
jgi:hypothetical protein